jgi:hypothetical protein
MYLHALHLPGGMLMLWHFQLLIECVVNLLLMRIYFVRAFFQYLIHWQAIYEKRKAFRNLAVISGKELLSLKQVANLVLDNIQTIGIKRLR